MCLGREHPEGPAGDGSGLRGRRKVSDLLPARGLGAERKAIHLPHQPLVPAVLRVGAHADLLARLKQELRERFLPYAAKTDRWWTHSEGRGALLLPKRFPVGPQVWQPVPQGCCAQVSSAALRATR